MATTKKKTVKKPASQYVGKNEFDAFKGEVNESMNTIVDLLQKRDTAPEQDADIVVPEAEIRETTPTPEAPRTVARLEEEKQEEVLDGGPQGDARTDGFLPPQYQRVFEKYFDPEDGFTATLNFPDIDEKGREDGGITFTIKVPEKFSNTTPAHKALYPEDLRTRALLPHSIAKGIEEWCAAVAKNLRYNKNIRTK
jgi:hypothetical protein